ncbi:cysteine--tRNA ligase [Candidatus Dependentiae bacterium]|nr:cysteine--tRNA ligase [Candidatus Dependentiae bacterium]
MKLTNTLTGAKELFNPLHETQVRMYVCGITPYDFSHVGHGRSAVAFDVVYRVLRFLGYHVTLCRNFTDIDDKLIARAQRELHDGLRYREVAERFMQAYQEDIQLLNCVKPTYEPCVTDHVADIISFVQGLIDAGKAYWVDGDVYFRINTFAEYGKLSKQRLDELRVGARVEVNEKKEDPLDFALWKGEAEGTFFKSPWGWGRPGWHIECSALAARYLGEHIDIHGGGADLIFPHHENEIAQSESLYGSPFARYWLHNAFVRINKEKMSKSLGNFFTLRDVYQKVHPLVLRFYFLSHHYRAPLDFAFDDIESLHKTYQRLSRLFGSVRAKPVTHEVLGTWSVGKKLLDFLCDDFNLPGALGVIFEHLSEIEQNPEHAAHIKFVLQDVFGLPLDPLPEKEVELTQEMQKLIQEREQARKERDWKRADALRDQLRALGYEGQDKKV